jgi:hypothetical protein
MTISGGDVWVDRHAPVVIGPPLRGDRFIAADSCCDATRHTRAALPVGGRVRIAQRYAVDWEQMDDANRIYVGPQADPKSYTIYGHEALAVADARVASVVDGNPEQTPGTFPEAITLAQADGNSVVLDLGGGRFALYAHLQPGSIRVHPGDRVTRGQVLGLVGNTGNSLAPHLHFHVMDGASPLDSNGLPYEIDAFEVTGPHAGHRRVRRRRGARHAGRDSASQSRRAGDEGAPARPVDRALREVRQRTADEISALPFAFVFCLLSYRQGRTRLNVRPTAVAPPRGGSPGRSPRDRAPAARRAAAGTASRPRG